MYENPAPRESIPSETTLTVARNALHSDFVLRRSLHAPLWLHHKYIQKRPPPGCCHQPQFSVFVDWYRRLQLVLIRYQTLLRCLLHQLVTSINSAEYL